MSKSIDRRILNITSASILALTKAMTPVGDLLQSLSLDWPPAPKSEGLLAAKA